MTATEYRKHPTPAWKARSTYLEHNGITDNRAGWTKRLGLSPVAFGNRLNLFKQGKITEDMLFRSAADGKKIHKEYEYKIPSDQLHKIRNLAMKKAWLKRTRAKPLHTIRIWESVFQKLKLLKPANKSWTAFLIDKFGLDDR